MYYIYTYHYCNLYRCHHHYHHYYSNHRHYQGSFLSRKTNNSSETYLTSLDEHVTNQTEQFRCVWVNTKRIKKCNIDLGFAGDSRSSNLNYFLPSSNSAFSSTGSFSKLSSGNFSIFFRLSMISLLAGFVQDHGQTAPCLSMVFVFCWTVPALCSPS